VEVRHGRGAREPWVCSLRMLNSSPWGSLRAGCMAVVTCGALGRHGPVIQVGHGGWVCWDFPTLSLQDSDTQHMIFRLHMVDSELAPESARVCAISCVVEGKLTVISARVIMMYTSWLQVGALCDSRGLRSPTGTVCYPLTASAAHALHWHLVHRRLGHLLSFCNASAMLHPRIVFTHWQQETTNYCIARAEGRAQWPSHGHALIMRLMTFFPVLTILP
jgi:hypothetical protein